MSAEAVGPRRTDRGRDLAEVGDARLLLPALVGWLGLVVCQSVSVWWQLAGAVIAAGAAVAAWRWGASRPGGAAMALTGIVSALLLGSAAAQGLSSRAGLVAPLAADRATVEVVATIAAEPRVLAADAERPMRVSVLVDVTHVVGRGQGAMVASPVLIIGDQSWADLTWRDRIEASGRLSPAESGQSLVAILTARGPPRRVGDGGPIVVAAESVRRGMRAALDPLPEDPRGLLPALVVGDRSLTPSALTDDMRATGLTHLSAVSGANVSLILLAVLGCCRISGLPRRLRPWVAGLVLAGFVVLARPDPSVLRAAAMGSIGLLGMLANRRASGLPALAGAVVVLLCVDPTLATSYGFALSTLATLGLLLFARPWAQYLSDRLPRPLRFLGPAIALPLAAQATCAPVIVLLQGSISVVGVLANLAAAPLVGPATILGIVVALSALLSPALAALVAWVAAVPAAGIAWIAHTCAKVPFGSLPWPSNVAGALLLAGLTVGALILGPWALRVARRHIALVVALLVVGVALWWPVGDPAWPVPGWRLVACDVGQGDALVLATQPGHALVVDAGPDPAVVDSCLRRLGVTEVDALVLTHYHADHVNGVPGVLHGRTVHAVYATPVQEPQPQAQTLARVVTDAGLPLRSIVACDVLVAGNVVAQAKWPGSPISGGSVPNNAGVVLDVSTPGLRLVLLADIEREAAAVLRRTWNGGCGGGPQPLAAIEPERPGRVDVLKVAHHGSANQDSRLLDDLAAPVSLISVGADNDYGHPAPSVLAALARLGSAVYRTDRDGDILVALGPNGLSVARRGR